MLLCHRGLATNLYANSIQVTPVAQKKIGRRQLMLLARRMRVLAFTGIKEAGLACIPDLLLSKLKPWIMGMLIAM